MSDGERIGLIGRNGTGKSSLLQVIAGQRDLDDGQLQTRDGLSVVFVEQEPELPRASSLRECLALRGRLDSIHDERERWRTEARLVEYLHRFGLDEATAPESASGGEKKRAALALAFALAPDLLLLDEPTNHLDLDGIARVEDQVVKAKAAIVITHDRAFLDRVATRIVELDRGLLRSYPGNFAAYETRKAGELAAEATAARKFDQFWAQEEAWIRKGVEARRTRDEGRVRRLEALRRERSERRARLGNVKLAVDAGERSGRLVAELSHVTKAFDGRTVVRDLTLRILRGDRLGLIGPNGAGKSTLLKLILGTLPPDSGTIRQGARLQIAYFDQLREQLDGERTLAETISPGSEWVETAGGRKHVLSYLADFLFPPQRADTPVRALSGGERNRLLLARLFARPANLLVLDEPTNDLDIESLELLETTLQTYPGTLLLVSHDRTFLDNVVTQTLVAESRAGEEAGTWHEYVGGYSDWLAQRPGAAPASRCRPPRPSRRNRRRSRRPPRPRRRESSRSPSGASSRRCRTSSKRWSASSTRSPSACAAPTTTRRARTPSRRTGRGRRKSSTRSPASSSGGKSSTAAARAGHAGVARCSGPHPRAVRVVRPSDGRHVARRHARVATPPAPGRRTVYHARVTYAPPRESPGGTNQGRHGCPTTSTTISIFPASMTRTSRCRSTTTSTTASAKRSWRRRTSCCPAAGRPDRVLNDALVEGMRIVGIDFRDGILFVPEVLLAANAMKGGMEILRPLLAETGVEPIGKMVIGTVKGDIHDIGKNLVAMMMEGAGFEVIDLGINNPVEKYLAALAEHKPDILGLSALLTTTMPYMKVVIDTMKDQGIRDDYIVLVGGAPLNEAFGKAVGADAYCRDAAIAVETAKALIAMRRAMRVAQ